ncbi:Rhomboid family protein [Roseovarius sp. THAF9]|uniref:rhomboid family intramembrane serine protease n=1 Tax=Roseovarius sp. THAF9 TaxID=2587847 RepID=UPI001267A7E0|nr:rhomboid family intramembrane serine protease [Roseovarius sp. THAF9]QFT91622.1 Rhomboid family protein [Roseovarius sp. THAF9]
MSDPRATGPGDSPVNPIPPLVLAIVAAMAAAEAVFQLGARGMAGGPEAIGWRISTIQQFGFSNRAMTWMLETGQLRIDYLIRFVTYPFVHASLLQAVFAIVMTLAIGKFVAERMAGWAVAILFFASSIFGALVFGLIYPDGPGLIGGFPGVYGLIGGFTCLVWLQLGAMGENQMRAFVMIGVLLGLQLVFGLLYGNNFTWVADIGGFVGGFFLSFLLLPGGMRRLRQKLQRR